MNTFSVMSAFVSVVVALFVVTLQTPIVTPYAAQVALYETPPACVLYAKPEHISAGDATVIMWHTKNAYTIEVAGVTSHEVSGEAVVYPDHTTTYQATVTGETGTATCSVTVTVETSTEEDVVQDTTAQDTDSTQTTSTEDGDASQQVTTVAEEDVTQEDSSHVTEYVAQDSVKSSCPFTEKEGRYIVDFTEGGTRTLSDSTIIANGTASDATRHARTTIPAGTYEVRLASYGVDTSVREYEKKWYVVLYDEHGSEIARTQNTKQVDVDGVVMETSDKTLQLATEVRKVVAMHTAYPSSQEHSVVPLCVALDMVEESSSVVKEPADEYTAEVSENVGGQEEYTDTDTHVQNAVEAITCPLPQREHRTIVDFTQRGGIDVDTLRNKSSTDGVMAKTPLYETNIRPGVYVVRYASYRIGEDTSDDVWFATLLDVQKKKVVRTSWSRDVPAWEHVYVNKAEKTLTIPTRIAYLAGVYTHKDSMVPLCVSFDFINPIETENSVSLRAGGAQETETDARTHDSTTPETRVHVRTPRNTDVSDTETARKATKEVVQVIPKDVGIKSAMRTVAVPKRIVETRKEVQKELRTPLFDTLLVAPPKKRVELVKHTLRLAHVDPYASSTISLATTRTVKEGTDTHTQPTASTSLFEKIKQRKGLVTLRDSDGDGVSDYDETVIYHTDPENPFTAGDVLTDGERILLGLDPASPAYEPVVVESPKEAGVSIKHIFSVDSISLTHDQNAGEEVHIEGKAPPLSFVTLYMYSTPVVVTVRADAAGKFEYVFDTTIENGTHELYVATVNNTGNILAKSPPVPFVKTALAISYAPESAQRDQIRVSLHTMITLSALLLLVVAIGGVAWIGRRKVEREELGTDNIDTHEA